MSPSPGTFEGTTSDGAAIVIVVDTIRSIAFECDGENILETFDPPKAINSDGTFSVEFTDAGRKFRVSGTFTDENSVEGTIDDANNHCDSSFSGDRSGVVTTPTPTPHGPTPTHTPGGGLTDTPTLTATPLSEGSVTVTLTPTGVPSPPCPNKVTIEGQGGQADLDTGESGLAFDQHVVTNGAITVALACPGSAKGSCGNCTVSGPIASTTSVNSERCSTDPSIKCTNGTPATACPSGGSCVFFFGAPLPLLSGGVGVCVTNQIVGQITGTANPDTGRGASQVQLASKVHTGATFKPCPVCGTGGFGSTGTCDEGPNAGKACTVDGTSPDLLGNTSLDCPPAPGANVSGASGLLIALNPTTEVSVLQPSSSTKCSTIPFNGQNCYCPGQRLANECDDGQCFVDATGKGECSGVPGPIDTFCATPVLPPHACLKDSNCDPGVLCNVSKVRKCAGQTDTGTTPSTIAITGNVTRTGTASTTNPVLVSTFCVGMVSAPAVNQAGGLPGPGALRLPSKACYADSCSF